MLIGQFGTADNLAPGQFGTGQFGTRTIWHRGQFGTMCKNGQFGTAENLAPWIFFIFPYPAPEGRTDTLKMSYIPQLLADYIQYKYIYIQLTHVPQPSARKGAQTPSKCHIFPNCWQCISNINVYSSKSTFPHPAPEGRTNTLQLTYISQLLAEYIQYLCIMSYNFLGMVPNCPWCQIVRSAKLSGAKLSYNLHSTLNALPVL